jgi:DNA-binding NarL/FixJ family response regulator
MEQEHRHGHHVKLSPREIEVLRLVRDGLSDKHAALELQISINTVRSHLRSIARKLDARNRTLMSIEGERLGLL